ncbi:hypothetical protein [Ancylobacter mangrovi]|uniref:Uncharacterized protein n=1 Tax=Ancylobacter mangrovi TaxID=2972472 RepID=A0A9X2PCX1_9HYPH|nr:hypothetical protein [Ancylobacter mangrovi]MCS0496424.1 hypothetical protein [Ancylobacter mangrovi]MCS0504432.1 hypothetical protein [Ancylobacter mangrovi]
MTSPDSEDQLDPAAERVLRKMRGFAAFSGLLMGFGFLAVFGAIGYRVVVGWKSKPAEITGTIRLPEGAQVRSAMVSGDLIAVTVERAGVVETHFFDVATRAPRGVLTFASEH